MLKIFLYGRFKQVECIYMHIYEFMNVSYVFLCGYIYINVYVCMYVFVCSYVYVCMYIFSKGGFVCMCMFACVYYMYIFLKGGFVWKKDIYVNDKDIFIYRVFFLLAPPKLLEYGTAPPPQHQNLAKSQTGPPSTPKSF